ncbi:hypothetical protein [Singulisphaera sp. PoT]|uniref:hypothetical protein n=1 Tax=Singulisphaera sp. PoT TaxID=3411797 RepID=UPI003BF49A3C
MAFAGMLDLLRTDLQNEAEGPSARSRHWGVRIFLAALLPALAAVWLVPGFVTQDGPAHLYNAHILVSSFGPESPFRDYYKMRWQPLPNWAGHLVTAAFVEVSPEYADQAVTTLTLAGFAASIVWLRWRVCGWKGMASASLLAVLLGLNVTWLLGFTGFLLGACLFPITLGYWWAGRERLGLGRVLVLGLLVTVGYFCHLVSLGLTVVGLGTLALFAPGPNWGRRLIATALSLVPLVPLGIMYLLLSRQGGGMEPVWKHLVPPTSFSSWFAQIGWVDPISLASRFTIPFRSANSRWNVAFAPVLWLTVGLALAAFATLTRHRREGRRCWWILGLVLLVGGILGPDTLGVNHGNYLQQRITLLGLVALVPCLAFQVEGIASAGCVIALTVALVVQSAFIWDYAFYSKETAGLFLEARPEVGKGRKIATLLLQTRGKFRANPLWHADNLLGVGTGNIVWNNYETRHYYFPVQFDDRLDRPSADEMERIATLDDPEDAADRLKSWTRLVGDHLPAIDTLVVWGSNPAIDAINDRWFEQVWTRDRLRIYRRR